MSVAQTVVDRGHGRSDVAGANGKLNLNLAREGEGGRRGMLREGGLRSLQEEGEETPAPVDGESETPSPGESEEAPETPSPQGRG